MHERPCRVRALLVRIGAHTCIHAVRCLLRGASQVLGDAGDRGNSMSQLHGLNDPDCQEAQKDEEAARNAMGAWVLAVAVVGAIAWVVLGVM